MKHEDREGPEETTSKEEQTPFRDLRGTTGIMKSYKHFPPPFSMLKPLHQCSSVMEPTKARGLSMPDEEEWRGLGGHGDIRSLEDSQF